MKLNDSLTKIANLITLEINAHPNDELFSTYLTPILTKVLITQLYLHNNNLI